MIIEPQTVSKVLAIAMDSVNLINSINSDASAEPCRRDVTGRN